MQFSPTELELAIMRALDSHPWYPPKAIAEAAGLTDLPRVRSTLAELRRFHLVEHNGRVAGGVGRYCLTPGGREVLIDTIRCRVLAGSTVIPSFPVAA